MTDSLALVIPDANLTGNISLLNGKLEFGGLTGGVTDTVGVARGDETVADEVTRTATVKVPSHCLRGCRRTERACGSVRSCSGARLTGVGSGRERRFCGGGPGCESVSSRRMTGSVTGGDTSIAFARS